jgi:hypothetical protein
VELGGVLIAAGAYVMASTAAANRDPAPWKSIFEISGPTTLPIATRPAIEDFT